MGMLGSLRNEKAFFKKLQDNSKKQATFDISSNVDIFFKEEMINSKEFEDIIEEINMIWQM
ncbi:9382_t:CDS:1, partial [Dentiscutata erythropus]